MGLYIVQSHVPTGFCVGTQSWVKAGLRSTLPGAKSGAIGGKLGLADASTDWTDLGDNIGRVMAIVHRNL